jgi:hypothetical protein
MGAIEQNGYQFDIEYSVSLQKGSIHVYKDGEYLEELTFHFSGEKPNEEEIQKMVDQYVQNHLH